MLSQKATPIKIKEPLRLHIAIIIFVKAIHFFKHLSIKIKVATNHYIYI